MTARSTLFYSLMLVIIGAGWGFTQPMTKIAVSEGYLHFGLIFWQLVIGAALMAAIARVRRMPLPLTPRHVRLYIVIAPIGTVVPNALSYQSAIHLPAGIISILRAVLGQADPGRKLFSAHLAVAPADGRGHVSRPAPPQARACRSLTNRR